MTTYPSCITDAQLCVTCYHDQSKSCAKKNSAKRSCEAVCNTDCNTKCVTAQTFCGLGVQTIINHADITAYGGSDLCYVAGQVIQLNWRASDWMDALTMQTKAKGLGQECSHSGETGTTIPSYSKSVNSGDVISSKIYNEMVARINYFGQSLATVLGASDNGIGDVIEGAHALIIRNGYNSMKFNSKVCDVCNSGNENRVDENGCHCDCNCECDCDCDCDCDCGCDDSGED